MFSLVIPCHSCDLKNIGDTVDYFMKEIKLINQLIIIFNNIKNNDYLIDILNKIQKYKKCEYLSRSVTNVMRGTDGVIQKVLKHVCVLMMLKAGFQKCEYYGRAVTKSETHTDGVIQKESMAEKQGNFLKS